MNIWNLTKKDLAVIMKDRGSIIWVFVLPVVFLIIFAGLAGSAAGNTSGDETEDTRSPLTVVNYDSGGVMAERFINDLNRSDSFRVVESDEKSAEQNLNVLKISRYVVIPEGFSDDLAAGKPVNIVVITHPSANIQITQTLLQIVNGIAKDTSLELQLLDGIRRMGEMQAGNPEAEQAFQTDKVLAQVKSQFNQSRITPLISVDQQEPDTEEGTKFSLDLGSTAVPGMAVLFVFLSASSVARSIYEERKIGSMRRLLSAPLTRTELMLGKLLPIWLVTMVQIVVIFAVGALVLPLFGMGTLGIGENPLAWAIASMFIALCSTSLGIFIAAIAKSEGQISGLSNALLWVAGFLGGALIPTFLIKQMPTLYVLSRLVPQSYATQAYYDVIARGANVVEILPSIGALLVFTAVFMFIGIRRFRFE
jgi:linearmycin/streptolysin S transport system permease protein